MQAKESGKIQTVQCPDLGQKKPVQHSYFMTMRLPDAQFFNAQYGISYAQQRVAHLGIKIDPKFKFEPALDPVPDGQGARYVTYLLHANMTAAQAREAKKLGFTVEREHIVHALGDD